TVGSGKQANPKRFYDFDQTRLLATVSTDVKSFQAKYCGDTYYIYIDSRSYNVPLAVLTSSSGASARTDLIQFKQLDARDTYAIADDISTGVRPYWASPPRLTGTLPSNTPFRNIAAMKPA